MNVSWISYYKDTINRGYWDQGQLEDLLSDRRLGYDIEHLEMWGGQIAVIPGRFHANRVERITERTNRDVWSLLIVTSDEEGTFPWELVSHPNWRLWVQTPRKDGDYQPFGVGYPPHCRPLLGDELPEKTVDGFFAGQITHERREDCARVLSRMKRGRLIGTEGFTQGLPPAEYFTRLKTAKVAPCPSGPLTPDTFRLYEALEAGCIPVVDRVAPTGEEGYWERLFGTVPFPVVRSWEELPKIVSNVDWPADANRIGSWWALYKRKLVFQMSHDIERLSGQVASRDDITVIMPTSPIPSHPDLSVIQETIGSIRERSDCEILVMADGVRPEQDHLRARYEEYLRRLIWWAGRQQGVTVIRFDEFSHQAEMTRQTLPLVETPEVMFVEHDTPLVNDIPFDGLCKIVHEGMFDVIRLHHETMILPDHKPLLVDHRPWVMHGLQILPTVQWSQRPHIARTSWYAQMIDKYFPPSGRTMIEDRIHGIVQTEGWGPWKVGIYSPDGSILRSRHLDARGDEPKFEMKYE